MNEVPALAWSLAAGLALGAVFFGGLWWTVRKCLSSRWAALLFLCSLLVRTAVALAGFYFVSGADWRRILACLLGFFLSRLLVSRVAGAAVHKESQVARGGGA